jgi:glutamine amidotransferase
MCRMYGFHATEATRVECSLVHAQNALLVQSRRDSYGESHADGWGVATFENGRPRLEKRALPAFADERFSRAAARAYARTVVAHVRAATVGPPCPENTHPFRSGRWVFAHNGTLGRFEGIRPRLLAAMSVRHRAALRGVTDSECLFRFLMSLRERHADTDSLSVLCEALGLAAAWDVEGEDDPELGLNVLWTDGESLLGARWGRPFWYLERDGIHDCEVCGFPHIRHEPGRRYRAFVVASEPLTREGWREVPDRTAFCVGETCRPTFVPLPTDLSHALSLSQ